MKKKNISSIFKKKIKDIFDRYKTLKKILPKKKLIVFDIGANEGQTIKEIAKNFSKADIHSFEPQESCQKNLTNLSKNLKKVKVFLNNVACGEKNKHKIFYVNSKSSVLSSFLKINTNSKLFLKMKKLSKQKKYLNSINQPKKIKQIALSSYIKKKGIKNIDIMKIDVQGYEKNVLMGIKNNDLKKIKTLVLEINLWDFYDKNTTVYDLEKILSKQFSIWDISFLYKNPKYFSTDYIDIIYINKDYQKKVLNR